MASLKHSTHSVTIEADYEKAWQYISDWRNQPKWATNFVKSIREDDGQIFMTTIMGESPIDWQVNSITGTIDIVGEDGTITPSRLVKIGDSLLYTFTFSMPTHVPEHIFSEGQQNMDEELFNLKQIVESLALATN